MRKCFKLIIFLAVLLLLINVFYAADLNSSSDNHKIIDKKDPIKTDTYEKTGASTKKSVNKEKVNFNLDTTAFTDSRTKIRVNVTNSSGKVNGGTVYIRANGKTLASKTVKNGVALVSIKFPSFSGKYKIVAEYYKGRKLTNSAKYIKLYDSEYLQFNPTVNNINPNTTYKYTVKVKSDYVKVNHGYLKLYFNNRCVGIKGVKNGSVSINYKLPSKKGKYKVSAVYFKNKTKVLTANAVTYVNYSHVIHLDNPLDFKKGKSVVINTSVQDGYGVKANSGKVIYYANNKKIGVAQVKNGFARLKYKVNLKAGVYTVTAVYYNNKNQRSSETSKKSRMWVIGPKTYGPGTSAYVCNYPPDSTDNWVINGGKWVRAVVYRNGHYIDYHGNIVDFKMEGYEFA